MRAKPSGAVIAGVVVGLIVYALAGYFLLISPQKGKAADLKRETETSQQQIDQYRAAAAQAQATAADQGRRALPADEGDAGQFGHGGCHPRAQPGCPRKRHRVRLDHPSGSDTDLRLFERAPDGRVRRELLRALRFPVPAPQPRARARGTPGCPGAALRRRHDQLRREHALVSRDQSKPDGARLRLRRCVADGSAGHRDCSRHDGHDVDDHAAHHDRADA